MSNGRAFSLAVSLLLLPGCALNYFNVEDPRTIVGAGPAVADIVKSLRCEVTTFLVANRLRQQLFNLALERLEIAESDPVKNKDFYKKINALRPGTVDQLNSLANISIDALQYASLFVNLKNVYTTSLSLSLDHKSPVSKTGDSHTNRYGPGYVDTRTFDLFQQLNVRQDSDLGPAATIDDEVDLTLSALADLTTTAYNPQAYQRVDSNFFCYKSLVERGRQHLRAHGVISPKLMKAKLMQAKFLYEAVSDAQGLLIGKDEWAAHAQFRRIYVGSSGTTLGKWLQEVATETTLNERTLTPVSARAILGQLQYQFALEVKPSLNFKYTLIAIPINPFVSDNTLTIQHSGTFAVYLNTPTAVAAFGAKQGNACHDKQTGIAGPCSKASASDKGATEETLKSILEAISRTQPGPAANTKK